MTNTIKDIYLENLWVHINANNQIVYEVDNYFYKINVIKEDAITSLSVKGNTNRVKNEDHIVGINKHRIKTKEQFIEIMKKQKNWSINGLKKFDDYFINFYKQLKKDHKKKIVFFIHKIYKESSKDFFIIANSFHSKLSPIEYQEWLSYLPKNIIKITNYNNIIKEVISLIEKTCPKEKEHEVLSEFLIKRASLLTRSETKTIQLRDALLEKYNHNKNLLTDYMDSFPSIKLYIQSNENSNYLEERFIRESFYIEVNYEKMKAVLAVPGWKSKDYKSWVYLLLDKLYEENKVIKSIKKFNEKEPEKKAEYLSIYIEKYEKNGITKKEMEDSIISFFKLLSQNYQEIGLSLNDRLYYVNKWYQMNKLNKELQEKPIQKIIQKL